MDSKRPVILGYDAVSPLGTDMERQWQRAVQGESGIGELTRASGVQRHRANECPSGEILRREDVIRLAGLAYDAQNNRIARHGVNLEHGRCRCDADGAQGGVRFPASNDQLMRAGGKCEDLGTIL